MRRLLNKPPKGIKYEILGQLSRATINTTNDYEPITPVPYEPQYCPVCGNDAGKDTAHLSVILALEFASGEKYEFVFWAHGKCIKECIETDEPDADLE